MPAVLSRLSILFINYMSRDLDNEKIHLHKLSVRYLIVKPACVNAALVNNKSFNYNVSIPLHRLGFLRSCLVTSSVVSIGHSVTPSNEWTSPTSWNLMLSVADGSYNNIKNMQLSSDWCFPAPLRSSCKGFTTIHQLEDINNCFFLILWVLHRMWNDYLSLRSCCISDTAQHSNKNDFSDSCLFRCITLIKK